MPRTQSVSSELDVGPGSLVLLLWVEKGWVRELSIVIFLVEVSLSGLGDSDEVLEVLGVIEVLVKVVLEVLEEVHVLLNEIVSSNSWESEGLVIKLPGVDCWSWVLSLLLELREDLHGIIVVSSVEVS